MGVAHSAHVSSFLSSGGGGGLKRARRISAVRPHGHIDARGRRVNRDLDYVDCHIPDAADVAPRMLAHVGYFAERLSMPTQWPFK